MSVTSMFNSLASEKQCPADKKRIVLSNCQTGIGIKIVGGKISNGPRYGIFVKRIISGSPAEKNGSLKEGDKVLSVNNEPLLDVTNERAMSVLLNAAKSGTVTLLVDRSISATHEYSQLFGFLSNGTAKYGEFSQQGSSHEDPTAVSPIPSIEKRSWVLSNGRMSPMSPGSWSPRTVAFGKVVKSGGDFLNNSNCFLNSERLASPAESNIDSGLQSSSSTLNSFSNVMAAHIPVVNGLGVSITGGINHSEGPSVIVKELVNGGDVFHNGQIKAGDQIISINDESFLNVTHEDAKIKLTQVKLKAENEFTITYVPQDMARKRNEGRFGDSTKHSMSMLQIDGQLAHFRSYQQSIPDQIGNTDQSYKNSCGDISSVMQSSIRPSSISHYLQQDLAASQEPPNRDTESYQGRAISNPARIPPKRRLSLAPTSKLQVEKLEVALSYLGIQLSPEQQQNIRTRLHIDVTGHVTYGDFVNAVQDVLKVELKDHSGLLNRGRLQYALNDAQKAVIPSVQTSASLEENQELMRQRDEAIAEANFLKQQLDEKRSLELSEAEKLESLKRTAEEALEESIVLKDQVYLAKEASKEAARRDDDYEEIIRLLKDELHRMKSKDASERQEFQNLQKKVVVLGSQLQKNEVIKRTYEVATQKLLALADHVHDVLKHETMSPTSPKSQNASGLQKLAEEALDIARGVRVLLEEEPLPFGWEEAYTSEGERYYINHVDQVTSWLHPVTNTTKVKSENV